MKRLHVIIKDPSGKIVFDKGVCSFDAVKNFTNIHIETPDEIPHTVSERIDFFSVTVEGVFLQYESGASCLITRYKKFD